MVGYKQYFMIIIEFLSRWKGLIYWGTALANAKYNNLQDTKKNNQRILLYGSVDGDKLNHILNDWIKLEVSACGK
jgi:hypothetical protein